MDIFSAIAAVRVRLGAALDRLLPAFAPGPAELCPAGAGPDAPLFFARRDDGPDSDSSDEPPKKGKGKAPADDEPEACSLAAAVEERLAEEGEGEDEAEEDEIDEDAAAELAAIEAAIPKTTSEWSGGSGKKDMDNINRFLAGDEQAFIALVCQYQNRVHNLCYRLLGDMHEAQDMSQEIFLTIHRSLKNFRGDSLFSTWVFRIATNHCKNRIKYLGRRKYYQSDSLDQPRQAEDGDIFSEVEDETPDPESQLTSDEIQVAVQEAISTLDEDHRLVIVLRDIQDQSYEEIAEALGLKVGTVKSRIHRARNELKRKLEAKLGK